MVWFPNPNRLKEVFETEKVKAAAETILSYRRKEVLLVIVYGWLVLLGMIGTLLLTIRLALTVPLFHG